MIKTTLKIDGMMCNMCEAHINDAIRNKFQIKKVSSSHKKGETLILSENEIPKEELEEVIKETGYELKSITSETYKKTLFGF